MAKIKKVKNKTDIKRHPALIVICILLFLLAGLAVYWFLVRHTDSENEAVVPTETTEEAAEEEITITENEEEAGPAQFEGEDPNQASELSGYISHASAERGILRVNTTINQSLTDGTCTLIMTDETGEEANFTADIVMDVTTAMCNFEENVDTLNPGTWQLEILLESGDKIGTIKGSVEI